MIFSNKLYKITNGKPASLYAKDNNNMTMYVFYDNIKKFNISLANGTSVQKLNTEYDNKFAKQLSAEYILLCYDENMNIDGYEE